MVSDEATRSLVKRLRDAGFTPHRTNGSHTVYVNGAVSVTVPDGHKTISPGVVRQANKAIKEASENE